ncbi:cyclic nucleotide-binding domain-containing protein [Mucilaginibacter koreensis]
MKEKPSVEEYNKLREAFMAFIPLPELVTESLLQNWVVLEVKRKQILTDAGNKEKYLYFVTEGIQRCYATHGPKEATVVFTYPYSFSGVVDSFLLQQPSLYNFETLTQSRLLRISYTDFFKLIDTYPVLEKWLRLAATQTLHNVLKRQMELSIFSAIEKINILYQRNPQLFNLVAHKYIASYLGIDPATFSKLYSQLG